MKKSSLTHRKRRYRRRYATSIHIGSGRGRSSKPIIKAILSAVVLLACSIVAVKAGIVAFNIAHMIGKAAVVTDGRTNIVVDWGGVALASFDRVDDSVAIFVLPQNLYVPLSHSDDSYRISAVYKAAEEAKKGQGGTELMQASMKVFGVPIDGFIKLRYPVTQSVSSARELKNNIASYQFLYQLLTSAANPGRVETNLSLHDALSLWLTMRHARFDKVTFHQLEDSAGLNESVLPDGTKVLAASDIAIDGFIGDYVRDPLVSNESSRVEIINASGIPGLGTQFARMVTNMGAQVVKVDTADAIQSTSELRLFDQSKSKYLTNRLLKLRKFTIISAQNKGAQLGNVAIVLGVQ